MLPSDRIEGGRYGEFVANVERASASTIPAERRCTRMVKKDYGLPDRNPASADGTTIDTSVVPVGPHYRSLYFRRRTRGVGIEIHHRTANVARGDGDGRRVGSISEREDVTHPFILLERRRSQQTHHDIGAESTSVFALAGEPADLAHCIGSDHRDAGVVECAVPQLHHLDRRSVPTSDFRGQISAEHMHVVTLGRPDVGGEACLLAIVVAVRRKEDQLVQLSRTQPREITAVTNPPKRQSPVAFQAVPSERGDVETL